MDDLNYLNLFGVRDSSVKNLFTQDRQFPNISRLALGEIDGMNADFVDQFAHCCPNCNVLCIFLDVDSTSASFFTRMFTRMKKLTSLSLTLCDAGENCISPSHLASYFSGLSLEDVRRIQDLPGSQMSHLELAPGGITSLTDKTYWECIFFYDTN